MKRQVVSSNWRDELSEYVNINNVTPKKAKTSDRAGEKVEEKKVNNKVVINPTMSEAFEELGGTIISIEEKLSKEEMEELQNKKDEKEGRKPGKVEENNEMKIQRKMMQLSRLRMRDARDKMKDEKKQQKEKNKGNADQSGEMMQQVKEKLDLKKADMGDVITDFRKSDAPQFKGKSDKKIQKMAIAAKLEADGKPLKSESAALDFMRSKYKDSLITPSSKPKAPSKKELDRRAANRAANQRSGPMAQDPYKSRAGESD